MHIAIANNIYPPIMAGGAELIVSYLAEGFAARGHRVTVVSTCGPEMEPYPVEVRNGVEVIRFFPKNFYWHWTRGDHPGYQKALWHVRDAWNRDAGDRFRAIIAEKKPDILHTHLIDGMSAILWNKARKAGVPVIHTAHDYHLLCPRSVMLTKSLELCYAQSHPLCNVYRSWHLRTTRDVNLFCSPSQFLIDKHKELGMKVPTQVVRNGIPLPSPVARSRTPGAPVRFLFAARHTVEKGCEVLIEATKRIPKDVPFELMVAGKGPLEEKFKEAAESDSRIRLLGYIQGDTKTETLRQADCMIIPSLWYENAPVVIVEAAAYGMGVIGSRIGAIPEFIQHEKTGLLFDAGDADSLAAAMTRVITDETLLPRFEKESRTLVESSSVDRMVDAYLQQYERVKA